ncbi:MAG: hypothetical protein AAGB02_08660 [Pseudomonadota bacterium]
MRWLQPFFFLAVGCGVAAQAADELSPTEQALYINLVAYEFHELCVGNDARIDAIKSYASDAGWFPRPVDSIRYYRFGRAPDVAWDGWAEAIILNDTLTQTKFDFIAFAKVRGNYRRCAVQLPPFPYEAIRDALIARGLIIREYYEFPDSDNSVWREAYFELPHETSHKGVACVSLLVVGRGEFAGSNLAVVSFLVSENEDDSGCLGTYFFGTTGPNAPAPVIDHPWGKKVVEEPPPPLD